MKIISILAALPTFLLLVSASIAEEDTTKAYYKAYNTCSPAAHYLTRQACNYGVIFERYYTDCMTKSGFSGESDASGSNYYEGYMRAYNICYSSAERSSQDSCNYGPTYQKHYNNCMAKYNFNDKGEKTTAKGSEDNEPTTNKEGFQFNF